MGVIPPRVEKPTTMPASEQRRRGVLFPDTYVWLVLVSSMDVMLTWLFLELGGREVNPVAHFVLHLGGFEAMVIFKFTVIVMVVLICEFIGKHDMKTARRLAYLAVGISSIPIFASLGQLAALAWAHS